MTRSAISELGPSGPSAAKSPWASAALSRRSVLRAGALSVLAATTAPLYGCSPGATRETTLRFYQTKPEVVGYFDQLIATFNAQQSGIRVTHDPTSSQVASFVRGKPHDLACAGYNLESATFVSRGVLTDLAGLPEAERIDPGVQALVDQYATYKNQTNVIPYSITACGVIYNQELFEANGVEVPTTWSELLAACETFQSAGVTPIYGTYRDPWTIQQGLFDYLVGGTIDVDEFFTELKAQGTDVGPDSAVSFQKSLEPAMTKLLQLTTYANADAASRAYFDGNSAFAQGEAAMYMQGPWALGEIARANPDARVGTFPLPATDDAQDNKVRVNLDLALWIPTGGRQPEAAREFLSYLMLPEVMDTYNGDNLAFSPVKDAPPVSDGRIAGLEPYIRESRFYQGAGTYVSNTIPLGNYLQEMVLDKDANAFLVKLDNDWRRLAQRSV